MTLLLKNEKIEKSGSWPSGMEAAPSPKGDLPSHLLCLLLREKWRPIPSVYVSCWGAHKGGSTGEPPFACPSRRGEGVDPPPSFVEEVVEAILEDFHKDKECMKNTTE